MVRAATPAALARIGTNNEPLTPTLIGNTIWGTGAHLQGRGEQEPPDLSANEICEDALDDRGGLGVVHTDLVDRTAIGGCPSIAVWWRRSL